MKLSRSVSKAMHPVLGFQVGFWLLVQCLWFVSGELANRISEVERRINGILKYTVSFTDR